MTKFLRKADAASRLGWHPEHMMRVAKDPASGFPQPVRIGANSVAFVESEIEAWMQARIEERDRQGYQPKPTNPRDNHRRAREAREVTAE